MPHTTTHAVYLDNFRTVSEPAKDRTALVPGTPVLGPPVFAHIALTLPTDESGGFQTPPHGGSRGPVQARVDSGIATTPVAPVPHLPPACLASARRAHAGQRGVLTEMITCMFRPWPPGRPLHMGSHGGAMHPTQRRQRVPQQIKHLTLWRFTFYAGDFPLQRPMRSIKELHKSIAVVSERNCGIRHIRQENAGSLMPTLFWRP